MAPPTDRGTQASGFYPEEPIDIAGLAAMAGIGYTSALTYRSAGKLPEPDGYVGRSPWWRPATVRAWLAARRVASEPT